MQNELVEYEMICMSHLAAHDGLDTVGDDISRLQGVTHAVSAHGDTVRYTDGVEAEAS